MNLDARKRLVILLWLITIHSFCVGLVLIFIPKDYLTFFGYSRVTEPFFAVQSGVFHLVMSVAYVLGAINLNENKCLIVLTVIAKLIAMCFLIIYYLLISPIWVILFSGIADGLMGIVVLWAYKSYCNCTYPKD